MRWLWCHRPARYDPFGLAAAVLFVCLSLTPSLLPRGPAFQGWLSGIVAAAGYGLGGLLHRGVRRLLVAPLSGRISWRPSDRLRALSWALLGVVGTVLIGIFLAAARQWQREAHRLIGQEPPGPGSPVFIVGLLVFCFVVLVAAARLIGRATRALATRLTRWLPVLVAGVASVVLVALGVTTVFNEVVLRVAFTWMDRVASATNNETRAGITRPTSPTRSGSPTSLVSWKGLGSEGRTFVTGGPTQEQLARFAGRPAVTPIRVYAGLLAAADAQQRAALAVAELERTGAFDRAVLCIISTTGTGWVDESSASALEFLYAGDTATVATQYSYLPSPVSFVSDNDAVEKEGRTLFARIHQRWSALPADRRPRLLLYGESLGSNGGQAAFADLAAMRADVDGALFAGPPSSNSLWQSLIQHRDRGSPEWSPTYHAGAAVRFAADEQTLDHRLPDAWQSPRVLFLQHATDPVVWWSPSLLLRRPDWLAERRGDGVSGAMSWYPIVTFWQVTADLVAANQVPSGYGHRYGDLIADGWVAVAAPAGWTAQDTARLRSVLRNVIP